MARRSRHRLLLLLLRYLVVALGCEFWGTSALLRSGAGTCAGRPPAPGRGAADAASGPRAGGCRGVRLGTRRAGNPGGGQTRGGGSELLDLL